MTQDDLFALVKSLTPAEKRYFKLYAQTHSSGEATNYLLLFDAIDKQTDYDEEAIKKKFKKEKFVAQLTFTKNTLRHKILDALCAYMSGGKDGSIEFELRQALNHLSALYQKGIYNQMDKDIRRLKKTASEYEMPPYTLQLLHWERRLLLDQTDKNTDATLETLITEENAALNQLKNTAELKHLHDRLLVSLKVRIRAKDADAMNQMDALLQHPLLQTEEQALTRMAKIYYHEVWSFYHWRMGNPARMYEHHKRIIELWENNPLFKNEHRHEYRKALCNFLNSCHAYRRFEDYPPTLEKINALAAADVTTEVKLFHITFYHELLYHLNTLTVEQGITLLHKRLPQLQAWKDKIHTSRLLAIYYNVALLYFFSHRFAEALTWLNEILYHPKADARQEVRQTARILQLAVHFELGNADLLDNLHRSAYRSLKISDDPERFEQTLLSNFKKLASVNEFDRKELKNCLQNFENDLQTLAQFTPTGHFLGWFEIQTWLAARLNGKKMTHVLKESL